MVMLLLLSSIAPAIAENATDFEKAPDLKLVAAKVYCSCGCGYVLDTCDCDTAIGMVREINAKLEEGNTPEQTLLYLASVYGSAILMESGISVENLDIENSNIESSNIQGIPFQILGFFGALYVAYKLGQRSGRNGSGKTQECRESQKAQDEWDLREV